MPGIKFGISVAISGAVLVAAASATQARTWKWVDENGTTHYSQSKPPGRDAEMLSSKSRWTSAVDDSGACDALTCRAARLERARMEREQAARDMREKAAGAAAELPIFPTPVKETDDEKIARLLAQCKSRRGSKCDSDEEMRRMLLQNVDLTHAERRALRGFSPAVQRRFLLQRIPKQYRNID